MVDSSPQTNAIEVRDLTMAYGDTVVQRDINFTVAMGEVFVIMGGSGCGKSTLLKHLIGLLPPAAGEIHLLRERFDNADDQDRRRIMRCFGVLYQSAALWSSMTVAENVALPLKAFTDLGKKEIDSIVRYKLSLVAMQHAAHLYPSSLSGGMRKRAGIARALALDPRILFLDEPSAGLDPVSSRRLDRLILSLRDVLGATVVVVTHELESIFTITDRALYLDALTKTVGAIGRPLDLKANPPSQAIAEFFGR